MAMATPVPTLGYWEAVSKLFAASVANLGLKATEAVFSRRQSPNVRFAPIADIREYLGFGLRSMTPWLIRD
jgi:hypothetical protein